MHFYENIWGYPMVGKMQHLAVSSLFGLVVNKGSSNYFACSQFFVLFRRMRSYIMDVNQEVSNLIENAVHQAIQEEVPLHRTCSADTLSILDDGSDNEMDMEDIG